MSMGECRCGHAEGQHDAEGRCNLYQEAVPIPGSKSMVTRPNGSCWCRAFNGEPWPWVVWTTLKPGKTNPDGTYSFSSEDAGAPFTVQQQGNDKTYGPYKSERAAERKADELNRLMVQGPLDPEFLERRKRLKRLAPRFGYLYSGPAEARWPTRPARYLIDGYDQGWHGDEWQELADSLEAVEGVLGGERGHEVLSVIDLDTGDEVPYQRSVTVQLTGLKDALL